MRGHKAIINTVAGLLYELVSVVCAFILPRLILREFGSEYNGITSAISQFLGYAALLKAGIGGVTKAALYKPLARQDYTAISGVINATDSFLKKAAGIFAASLVIFAGVYAFLLRSSFEWIFTFTLVLIMGIGTFAQYFLGLKYQLLLFADQRQCVLSFVQIFTTILNTLLSVILIRSGAEILVVQLFTALTFSLNPLFLSIYARKTYKIDKSVPQNTEAIKDRWDCFGIQLANFVNSNTALLILSVFTNVLEVSVYSVYTMVTSGIRQIVNTFVHGLGAAFGNMFAQNEQENIKRNMRLYEQLVFSMANFLFSVTMVRIVPFVSLYTQGIHDVEYTRWDFSIVLVTAILFTVYRVPYQAIVEAVGHFKQTRNGAFLEAGLHIVISVVMVNQIGMIGVTIGTLFAAIFRTLQYSLYVSRYVIPRSIWILVKRLLLSALSFIIITGISNVLHFPLPENYGVWILQSIYISVIAAIVILAIELVFYTDDLKLTISKIFRSLGMKKHS